MSFAITLKFLEAVKENNNTTWLHTYRDLYQQERQRFSEFIEKLLEKLSKINPDLKELTPKDCIFRFNRDIRFSPNKHPYKEYFGASIAPGGRKSHDPCFYLHLEPGNCFIAAGQYLPSTAILHKTRKYIATHLKEWKKIISNSTFKKTYGEVLGKSLVKMPRGYDAKSPAAERFLHKDRYVTHKLSEKEIISPDIEKKIINCYRIVQSFNTFLEGGLM